MRLLCFIPKSIAPKVGKWKSHGKTAYSSLKLPKQFAPWKKLELEDDLKASICGQTAYFQWLLLLVSGGVIFSKHMQWYLIIFTWTGSSAICFSFVKSLETIHQNPTNPKFRIPEYHFKKKQQMFQPKSTNPNPKPIKNFNWPSLYPWLFAWLGAGTAAFTAATVAALGGALTFRAAVLATPQGSDFWVHDFPPVWWDMLVPWKWFFLAPGEYQQYIEKSRFKAWFFFGKSRCTSNHIKMMHLFLHSWEESLQIDSLLQILNPHLSLHNRWGSGNVPGTYAYIPIIIYTYRRFRCRLKMMEWKSRLIRKPMVRIVFHIMLT